MKPKNKPSKKKIPSNFEYSQQDPRQATRPASLPTDPSIQQINHTLAH